MATSAAPSSSECRILDACWKYDEDHLDASQDLKQNCHGWPELVDVMVRHPNFESFQAFRDLNIKSLLYYQAELVSLRKDLHEIEWQDHRKGGKAGKICGDIENLLLTKFGEEHEQLDKMNEIREVLKKYS